MKALRFTVVTDTDEAKALWEKFSPHRTIDDDWDFRYAFFSYLESPLHFIVGYDGDEPIGILPLQYNQVKGLDAPFLGMTVPFLEFFGGIDTDNNQIFILPEYEPMQQLFLEQITQPAILTSLRNPLTLANNNALHYLDRYELDLHALPTFQSYVDTYFSGKSRNRLLGRINKFNRDYEIDIQDGGDDALELLFAFNMQRFGEQSSFHRKERKQIYHDLGKLYDVDIFTIALDGVIKAVTYGIRYQKTYVSINMGYDNQVRDIAKLIFITRLKRALERGDTLFDAGQGNNGWKEHFHLTKVPQYKLVLNYQSE